MRNKDNCGAAGTKELNILPTKCKAFLFDMGISTASVFLSNEVGELSTKYQAWHKLMAVIKKVLGDLPLRLQQDVQTFTLLKCATKSEIHSRLKMGQFTGNQDKANQECLRLWIQATQPIYCRGSRLEAWRCRSSEAHHQDLA
jgi:hypothetical protein